MSFKKLGDKPKAPPKDLSKRQELNNHIVCMRSTVTQVRVQIINRLVHQVKKYKSRKGGEKEQEKARRKAKRLVEEIQALKKLKKDKASVYSLQDTNDLERVLGDPTASSEERVLSRVSHHSLIKKKVSLYREANPNWDKQIPVLLSMTRAKRKKKKDSNESEIIVKEEKSESEEESTDTYLNENNKKLDIVPAKQNPTKRFEKTETLANTNNKEPSVKSISSPVVQENSSCIKQSKPTATQVDKVKGTVKVKLLADLNDLELDAEDEEAVISSLRAPELKKRKSSFFVGGVDEPEDKPVTFDRPRPKSNRYFDKPSLNDQSSYQSQGKDVYRKGKLIKRAPRSDFQRKPGPNEGRFGNNFNAEHHRPNSKSTNFGFSKVNTEGTTTKRMLPHSVENSQSAPEKLHPSWEAKKKQQISLGSFEGKRIVFDDDD